MYIHRVGFINDYIYGAGGSMYFRLRHVCTVGTMLISMDVVNLFRNSEWANSHERSK
jgi:hypothetical protein